jgi:hypothetical protein
MNFAPTMFIVSIPPGAPYPIAACFFFLNGHQEQVAVMLCQRSITPILIARAIPDGIPFAYYSLRITLGGGRHTGGQRHGHLVTPSPPFTLLHTLQGLSTRGGKPPLRALLEFVLVPVGARPERRARAGRDRAGPAHRLGSARRSPAPASCVAPFRARWRTCQ